MPIERKKIKYNNQKANAGKNDHMTHILAFLEALSEASILPA
tara:strand:- start:3 stop:128 length:126 start_codon:yes stop_codon:yes gene_type:complete